MSSRWILLLGGFAFLIVVSVGVGGYAAVRTIAGGESRQEEVAARGAVVMPFDLEKTTHVFNKTDDGGVETVVADDGADTEQVTLIREHLRKEANLFARGDFSDPVAIHGADMPGVKELAEGASRLEIEYRDLSDGASLIYSSADGALVDAIHEWFDAQLSDHGSHATHGNRQSP
jgi:hypothetical protein